MIRFFTDAQAQVAAALIISVLALLLSLLAQNKRAAIISGIGIVFMVPTALDLMTDTMELPVVAEALGLVALGAMLMSFRFTWMLRLASAIGHLFIASFCGLMAINLGIERFESRTEWWNNFNTFENWATGAMYVLLIPALIVAFRMTRQTVVVIRKRLSERQTTADTGAEPEPQTVA